MLDEETQTREERLEWQADTVEKGGGLTSSFRGQCAASCFTSSSLFSIAHTRDEDKEAESTSRSCEVLPASEILGRSAPIIGALWPTSASMDKLPRCSIGGGSPSGPCSSF